MMLSRWLSPQGVEGQDVPRRDDESESWCHYYALVETGAVTAALVPAPVAVVEAEAEADAVHEWHCGELDCASCDGRACC